MVRMNVNVNPCFPKFELYFPSWAAVDTVVQYGSCVLIISL